jgi:two-component system NtrC family sensor kinase
LVQSEKMASLGTLVAGIAHEINTPVGAISSMHDTLIRAVGKLKSILEIDFQEVYCQNQRLQSTFRIIEDANKVINSGTDRVTNIVRRLRSFARLDEAELKTVDIHEGLEDTLILVHHEIKHNIKVVRNYGNIPLIACYPGQLNQVFLNLLMNAKQAIKDSGEIEITTYQQDKKVHIAFRDNGVGIAGEHLNNIFDPGFTTKGVGVGTGLGLSICYKIMQAHHGEILVESEVGKGSTFTVVVPMDLENILEQS